MKACDSLATDDGEIYARNVLYYFGYSTRMILGRNVQRLKDTIKYASNSYPMIVIVMNQKTITKLH